MGLLLFIFFVVPYAALGFWLWRETVGMANARSALLGNFGSDDVQRSSTTGLKSETTAGNSARSSSPGSTTDKIKGLANEGVGNVKQGIGKATGNEELRAEGDAQELEGKAQKTGAT